MHKTLELNFKEIGLKVGLEIHQQLATNKKLFCNCSQKESEEYTKKFSRKLRISKSEMGGYDPAALFEKSKSKTIMYYANPESSCLVEQDEEPPHDIDNIAKETALLIASSLESSIFREIFPMRKMVIDGSNTSGFQRTMLIAQGGKLVVDGKNVGIQSICLEEDASKLIGDKGNVREYSLDRLGVPLIEIALEPLEADPREMRQVALSLGRLLRTTKKVTRGIGSIRQDVNVSVSGSGVVEVKGVQQLDQLENVVAYEAKRQDGLMKICQKIKEIGKIEIKENDVFEITDILKECQSKIIQKSLKNNWTIKAIKIRNFAGMFGFEPYEGIRLGKEIGQLVRFFGIGGVFHSDELPNYGIEESDVNRIKKHLEISEQDGFLIISAENTKIDFAIQSIINRIHDAQNGVPAETRLATPVGETVYLRPRPGPSRMYPETDIPPIFVTKDELEYATNNIPKSWDESILELEKKYELNSQLAEQVFDSQYLELFEKICNDKKVSPNFVASTLCSTITNLERKGLKAELLKPEEISESFELLSANKISKESIEMIFENIMAGKSSSVKEAIEKSAISSISEKELEDALGKIIEENIDMVRKQKERSIGPLMGIVMKKLRGKASGETINRVLQNKISEFAENEK